MTDKEREDFIRYAVTYKNRKMAVLFQTIWDNGKAPDHCLQWVDGFGLGVLHYSIVLHKQDSITYLCNAFQSKKYSSGHEAGEVLPLYEYGTVDALVGEEDKIGRLVLFLEEIRSLLANKAQLQVLLKMKNASLLVSQKTLNKSEEEEETAEGISDIVIDVDKYLYDG